MSQKQYVLTEEGEKMIMDAFEATARCNCWPPPDMSEEDEESIIVLAVTMLLSNGMSGIIQAFEPAGLSIPQRRQALILSSACVVALQLHDLHSLAEVAKAMDTSGLDEMLLPYLNIPGDTDTIMRDLAESMSDPAPEGPLKMTIQCCSDTPTYNPLECCGPDDED